MISDPDDFFTKGCGRCDRFATAACSAQLWAAGLLHLRAICRSAGLEEAVRWGHPCYRHKDRNIAIIGAFQGNFVLSFLNAALMTDPDGVLVKQGPNTQYANAIRFTDAAQVAQMEPIIRAYLDEAMRYAEEGKTAPRNTEAPELPDELVEALDADAELAEAFNALTPGRQRSYVISLSGAKTSETRFKRIAKFRSRIIDGKGAMER